MLDELKREIVVVKLLREAMDSIRRSVEHEFRDMKLTAPQCMILGILAGSGRIKIGELSKKIGLSNSTVSGIIDRLERQGLVKRKRSDSDKRVVNVQVTPKFRDQADKHFNDIDKRFEAIMDQAAQEELEKVIDGLKILKELFDRNLKGRYDNAKNN